MDVAFSSIAKKENELHDLKKKFLRINPRVYRYAAIIVMALFLGLLISLPIDYFKNDMADNAIKDSLKEINEKIQEMQKQSTQDALAINEFKRETDSLKEYIREKDKKQALVIDSMKRVTDETQSKSSDLLAELISAQSIPSVDDDIKNKPQRRGTKSKSKYTKQDYITLRWEANSISKIIVYNKADTIKTDSALSKITYPPGTFDYGLFYWTVTSDGEEIETDKFYVLP